MEKISDKIIDRAVELWCRKLKKPVFNNGDDSEAGFIGGMLATLNMDVDKVKIFDMEKSINIFRKELSIKLKQLRDNPKEGEYFTPWLDVDYGPCKTLSEVADKAGIPYSQFSCKTFISMRKECVTTSFGYGGEPY